MRKKDRVFLERLLRRAETAANFILKDDVAVCRRSIGEERATTILHYTRPADDSVLYEIQKEVGSDLVALFDVVSAIRRVLDSQ